MKIVKNLKELKISINSLFKIYKKLLIEKYIRGQEIQVAVINGKALGAIQTYKRENFMIIRRSIQQNAKKPIM